MTETAQPAIPAEDEIASTADQLAAAAGAFKRSLGQADQDGDAPAASDEADEAGEVEGGEVSPEESGDDEAEEGEEAAEAAQPDAPLPMSWPAEQAGLWRSLPPEAQAFIAARDGQMTAALTSKFQEAAQLRKTAEDQAAAEIGEAQLSRARYAEAVDQVLSLVVPQAPPRSMLDRESGDYDPDAYHYRKALHEETVAFLNQHAAQRREIAAQALGARFEAINGATRDAFVQSVPDAADQAKAPAVFQELIDYALSLGTPADLFQSPTTALEWHVLWKAREYDRLEAAKARVGQEPRPEPKKAAPAVRPGVTTPRSAIEQSRTRTAMERLRNEGSVDAGAAALKQLLKGRLS